MRRETIELMRYFSNNNQELLFHMVFYDIDIDAIEDETNIYTQIQLTIEHLLNHNNTAILTIPSAIRQYVDLVVGNINDRYSMIGQALIESENSNLPNISVPISLNDFYISSDEDSDSETSSHSSIEYMVGSNRIDIDM